MLRSGSNLMMIFLDLGLMNKPNKSVIIQKTERIFTSLNDTILDK